MDWETQIKQEKQSECRIIFVGCIFLLIGLVLEIMVHTGILHLSMEENDSFILTLLQIQGTIVTLTVAIIALLAGNSLNTIFGISVTEFYLKIKPIKFNLRNVTIIEFLLLVFSVFLYLFKLNFLIIAVFMVEVLIIISSICKTYEAFKGKNYIREEIFFYLKWKFNQDKDTVDKGVHSFLTAWIDELPNQVDSEYNKYEELLFTLSLNLVEKYDAIRDVSGFCETIARGMLKNTNENIKIKGIDFVQICYEKCWEWILNNKEKASEIEYSFKLLSKLSGDWNRALFVFPSEIVEQHLHWSTFSDNIIRVACYFGYKKEENGEVYVIRGISRLFGYYLNQQRKKGNIVNYTYWSNMFSSVLLYGGVLSIPLATRDFYGDSIADIDIGICYGYLLNGEFDLVKEGIFLEVENYYKFDSISSLYRILMIHMLMYYLGYVESCEHINEDIKNGIVELLNDSAVVCSMNHCMEILGNNSEFLTVELQKKLENGLGEYEQFGRTGAKLAATPFAAKDYYMFVVLYTSHYFWKNECIRKALNPDVYFPYLLSNNHDSTKKRMKVLYKLFEVDSDPNSMEKNIDVMMDSFLINVKNEYKKGVIKKAAEEQTLFENGLQEKVQNQISEFVEEKFQVLFEGFSTSDSQTRHIESVVKYKYYYISNLLYERIKDGLGESVLSYFVDQLVDQLKEQVIEISINDLEGKYYEKIDPEIFDVIFGSNQVFSFVNFRNWNENKEFLEKFDCRFTSKSHHGLVVKKNSLHVNLEKVQTKIFSPILEEMGIKSNEETGMYNYEPISGLSLEFEEEELRKYIHDGRKIIEVIITGSFSLANNADALIVKRKRTQ